jgi:hypothetical protein
MINQNGLDGMCSDVKSKCLVGFSSKEHALYPVLIP